MAKPPIPETVVAEIAAAIAALWEEGCPVASQPEETARVAVRRWRSSARRRVKQNDREAQIRDLVKGLIEQFEEDPALVGGLRRDYRCVAERAAAILSKAESVEGEA